jgi:Kef-type K+ transport system membrane component KefB
MDTLFWIGLLLLAGYVVGRITERFSLPKISGYILVGILLSPSVSHVLPPSFLSGSESVIHFALAVIAFMIGGSFKYAKVKKLERTIFGVMLGESETAFAAVALGMFVFLPHLESDYLQLEGWRHHLLVALFLGAISSATAPAAVLAVIHQYRAKGPLTTTLLGVVATDDAVALINFSLVLGIVAMLHGDSDSTVLMTLLLPVWSILLSLLIGGLSGWLQGYHIERISKESNLVISTLGVLLLLFASAEYFGLNGLLLSMAFGFALANSTEKSDEIFRVIQEHFEELIFVLFFIISGATVELEVLSNVWHVALLYVLLRILGKVAGSWFGASLSGSPHVVKRYMGFALMPQAGVAIGLALMLYHHPQYSDTGLFVLNTIIAATALNEIIGPFLLKTALFKAEEAKE